MAHPKPRGWSGPGNDAKVVSQQTGRKHKYDEAGGDEHAYGSHDPNYWESPGSSEED